jgi:hypothetical protein
MHSFERSPLVSGGGSESEAPTTLRLGERLVDARVPRPRNMNVRLGHRALMPELVTFLRKVDCVVEQTAPDTLEATIPGALDERQERLELELYLRAWHVLHPAGLARVVH